jgi:hypothetical protein
MTPYTLHSGAFAAGSPVKMRDAGLAGRDATGADAAAGTNALAVQMAAAHIATPPATPARGAAATASPAGAVGAARVRLRLHLEGQRVRRIVLPSTSTVLEAVRRCVAELVLELAVADAPKACMVVHVDDAVEEESMNDLLEDVVGTGDLAIACGGREFPLIIERA